VSHETTTSKVEVKWVEEDVFVASDGAGHSVVFDSGLSRSNAHPRGIGPMSNLLASLGACSGMDVAAILLKRKQKLRSLTVEVSGQRPKYGFPKPFTEVRVLYRVGGGGLDERYVKEAVTDSMTKFCSVVATIDKGVKVDYSYALEP
jgi:putative redox protein